MFHATYYLWFILTILHSPSKVPALKQIDFYRSINSYQLLRQMTSLPTFPCLLSDKLTYSKKSYVILTQSTDPQLSKSASLSLHEHMSLISSAEYVAVSVCNCFEKSFAWRAGKNVSGGAQFL
jgi:hypothetical protein